MKKTILKSGVVASVVIITLTFNSCKKEPVATAAADGASTLIFIRAVDKDSSVTNSDQILLR
jgi:hypothetical protein